MKFRVRLIGLTLAAINACMLAGVLPAAWAASSSVVQLTSAPNPAVQGQPVTYTAEVLNSGNPIPTGTVTFLDGTTALGTIPLDAVGSAKLTISTSSVSVGVHSISAAYSGDPNFLAGSSQPLLQTILSPLMPTATILRSSLNPASIGQSVTFSAEITVSTPSGTHPTGTVTFLDGGNLLGTAPAVAFGGGRGGNLHSMATLTPNPPLGQGSHSIQAIYPGDSNFSGSTSAILVQVVHSTPLPTTTKLSSSANPSILEQAITFTATVTSAIGTPTGTITFMDGLSQLATVGLNGFGQAFLTTSSLSGGTHPITAAYSGDGQYATSVSTIVNQVVQGAPGANTNTMLTSSANPSTAGQPITLLAKVTSASGTPTGTVTFKDGPLLLAPPVSLDPTGAAVLQSLSLSIGSHLLYAFYSGDTDFAASSAALNQVVNSPQQVPTTTDITSSANPSSYGQAISFTTTVTGTGGIPTGNINLNVGSTITTITLDASGHAVFTTSVLSVGTTSLSAVYPGDAVFAGSTSPMLKQVVNQASTTTALTSSLNPSSVGVAVIFSAFVASATGGAPTGSVGFQDGSSSLGSAAVDGTGHAQLSVSSLPAGTHNIVASYGGDNNYQPSASDPVTQVVSTAPSAADFSLSVNPGSQTITAGQSASYTVTVTASGGFNQTLSLACSGAPTGSTCTVSPGSVNPNGATATATLTLTSAARVAGLQTPPFLPSTKFPASILFAGVTILSLPLTRKQRIRLALATAVMSLLVIYGGCGGGTNSRSSNVLPAAGGTPAGTYTITVTATSSVQSHSTTATLTVN